MLEKRHFLIIAAFILLTGLSSIVFYATRGTAPLLRQNTVDDKSLQQLFEQAQSLQIAHVTQQEPQTVTFLTVGDISLSRNIAQVIKTKQDALYPFRNIGELLKSTDFNFGNLETPFSGSDAFNPDKTLVFNAPKTNIAGLIAYNFAVLNLANNHAFDQGLGGIETTTQVLDAHGLLHMGTGRTLDEAWTPAIIDKNGIKIGFIGASYASINDGGKAANIYVARLEDTKRLESNVKSLKSNVDFVVVTMHAGTEYTPTANAQQTAFAHAAIDAGADIVIGAHPHWVQNKEFYCPKSISGPPPFQDLSSSSPFQGEARRGENSQYSDCKWIYYSLGNFIFDQAWSEQTKKGLALKITVSKSGSGSPPFRRSDEALTKSDQWEVRGGENNAAMLNDLQPAGNVSKPETTIEIIEEIPIYIKENCCPIVDMNKK